MCPGGQDGQGHPGQCQKQCNQQDYGSDCRLVQHCESTPQVLCSVLGLLLQEGYVLLEPMQRRAVKLVKGLGNKSYEE